MILDEDLDLCADKTATVFDVKTNGDILEIVVYKAGRGDIKDKANDFVKNPKTLYWTLTEAAAVAAMRIESSLESDKKVIESVSRRIEDAERRLAILRLPHDKLWQTLFEPDMEPGR